MTPQQIKANAPEGASHYIVHNDEAQYIKRVGNVRLMWISNDHWAELSCNRFYWFFGWRIKIWWMNYKLRAL